MRPARTILLTLLFSAITLAQQSVRDEAGTPVPAANAKLISDNQLLAETSTTPDGTFEFASPTSFSSSFPAVARSLDATARRQATTSVGLTVPRDTFARGHTMQFFVSWTIKPEHRDAATARFVETGGLPPAGVKMVGRWHFAEGREGLAIAESDDAVAIGKWTYAWFDLLSFRIVPIVDDEGFKVVLGG